jgi:hypothetical protein
MIGIGIGMIGIGRRIGKRIGKGKALIKGKRKALIKGQRRRRKKHLEDRCL